MSRLNPACRIVGDPEVIQIGTSGSVLGSRLLASNATVTARAFVATDQEELHIINGLLVRATANRGLEASAMSPL